MDEGKTRKSCIVPSVRSKKGPREERTYVTLRAALQALFVISMAPYFSYFIYWVDFPIAVSREWKKSLIWTFMRRGVAGIYLCVGYRLTRPIRLDSRWTQNDVDMNDYPSTISSVHTRSLSRLVSYVITTDPRSTGI